MKKRRNDAALVPSPEAAALSNFENAKLQIERESDGENTLRTAAEFKSDCPLLYSWMADILWGNADISFDKQVQVIYHKTRGTYTLNLFTATNVYHISAVLPKGEDERGYLGCIAQTRKHRAGETWLRGNDLPDGQYRRETFDSIVQSIVAYELVSLYGGDR